MRHSLPFEATVRAFAAVLLIAVSCTACDGDRSNTDERSEAAAAAAQNSDAEIVARLDDAEIALADIEAPFRLQLHDLAMQRFRLLRQSLLSAALRAIEESPSEFPVARLSLEPPLPPRLSIEADPLRVRPAGEAAVTLLAFCNFESPHCARLQITLAAVLPLYPGVVRFGTRDLPLPFHRNAGRAAAAALCALEQGNYWRFHDALYAGSGPLDAQRLARAARAALLDLDAFDACLDSGRRLADVAADAALAARLSIATVPAVFVNGLYASPEIEPSDLIWLIEQELARIGVASPRLETPSRRTTAPLILRALLASDHAGQGVALLSPAVGDGIEAYGEGGAVSESVIVERITRDGVELVNSGVPELLDFGGPDPNDPGSETQAPAVSDLEAPPLVTPHRAVPVRLDRTEVLIRLSDRAKLHDALAPVPMTAGGYHLLRITEVDPGSLYELLGLEPGDVLLGVNEQPVHEADNPLWNALEKEDEVRVRLMRRGGVSQHYTYRFDE